MVGIPARRQGQTCLQMLERYGTELGRGALVTVDSSRVRIRS